MSKNKDLTIREGTVEESLPGGAFKVRLVDEDRIVRGQLSGKMRKFRIKIVPGDRVSMEFTPYDEDLGRINRRL
ncbi:MAG: translation initiation factor IF-1 [Candidatus Paceibacterota bacterium]